MFSHGGARPGAGRPVTPDRVSHQTRPEVKPRTPVHVTLTLSQGCPTLRSRRAYRIVATALYHARQRFGVRIVVQSTLGNHLHLLAEAPDHKTLGRAMQGLSIRLARRLNRLWGRRGKVFRDRYHSRVLSTPLEVRRALAYVLLNQRHHAAQRGRSYPRQWVDPYSSGFEFHGWSVSWVGGGGVSPPGVFPPTVVAPRTWLLRVGWRRHGAIRPWEVPGRDRKRS